MLKAFYQCSLQYCISVERDLHLTACCFIKSLKKHLDFSKVPKLNEQDLKVQYVRGSGPGGQSTNKTSNCVVLKHMPTGIVIKCHETRSQFKNKEIAEERLINKLDLLLNGDDAVENQKKRILLKKALEKKRRHRKRAEEKAALKELEQTSTENVDEKKTE